MICAICGGANNEGAGFCDACGNALQAGCPSCGAVNRPGAQFCNTCGTPLSATVDEPAKPGVAARIAPEQSVAQRRVVTVLFADLVGFTPFAEERDAEEVRDTLSRYFDLASDVITRYGGTIEKFIGDAVMAVWGAPIAHEDDAERAVRAALDLVDVVGSLGPTIEARAGVLTGEAAVTIGATNQGLVAGDLVNTASRLQSVAPPASVLVGEATYRAASSAIAFEEVGEQILKGRQSPVPAWRATRVVAERGGRNRTEGMEAPFVGRAEDLRLLKDLFHATGRERRTRVVSVMGPAGIGKSRLAWEFLKYVDGQVGDVYWHSGRSPAYGAGITFWALGEMVRGRCGLLEADEETTTRQRVSETVGRWVTDEDERRWVEPALLALLGIESDMASDELFGAWRTFFQRIAGHGTVVLVFEDLHHADTGTLDFIDHLLDWSRGLPIYVVTLARPELLDKRPDWGAGKRNFASLRLEPLPEAQMRELLDGLVPGLPGSAFNAIVDRADGIPLYAVETVRMLVAAGRLRLQDGVYAPVGDLSSLAVPDTLTALIASRLDALETADRAIVHDAAVLGQSFSLTALAAISGAAEGQLEPRLAALVRRELFTRDVDPRSPERGQYAFVQALIREVAYNTLSKKDRKARHLAAARFFEQLGSDELAGALAGHYLSAHLNAPKGPEAEALAAQARLALRGAAERAVALGAQDQAIDFLEQALTVTTDPADQADLLLRAGESATAAARNEKADMFLRQAIELNAKIGDRKAAARATAALAWSLLTVRSNQAALTLLESAAAEYEDLWPDAVAVELRGRLARAYEQNEQHQRAVEVADTALAAAEHADLVPVLARILIDKGSALGNLGRLREAIALINAGEQLARDNGLNEQLLNALVTGGFHRSEIDEVAALASYREGLALARRLGQRQYIFRFVNNVGWTSFLVGDWDGALAELDGALAEDLDRSRRVYLLANALSVRALRGESVSEGMVELEQLTSDETEPDLIVQLLWARANVALRDGQLSDAASAWRRAASLSASQAPAALYEAARSALWARDIAAAREDLAALDATGFHGRVVEARRTTIRAGLAALEGNSADALSLYRDALRGWRELGLAWDEALTGVTMATLLDPTEPEVRAAVDSTREILVRLGATPFLERLDATVARSVPDGVQPVGAGSPPNCRGSRNITAPP